MCGIFAAINEHSVTPSLLAGLEALSYRGYDSAGIAVIGQQGLERRRAEGKLHNLAQVLKATPLEGAIGIAHTRWATHGSPTMRNAHPHMSSRVAVAHNGIIENYQALRDELVNEGYFFQSETDSETIPLLITRCLDLGMDHEQAVRCALDSLEGSFAIAAVFTNQPDMLFAARQGSPLVIGKADDGFYIASDTNALTAKTFAVCHLEDGDLARISRDKLAITDPDGRAVTRAMQPLDAANLQRGKQGYRHYMLKEIHEQPEVVRKITGNYLDPAANRI